ncbi:gamma-glutamyl-gamma-aminobutyrate hydrolase family protein [Allorhizobium undicola]|uniref:gamma-glutamyl-gamma-aminobutyrate hydrolase family protein n=1 Tax=Allorhizobium undicola TaxID=78527 RepID=UPI0004891E53|nr:gamma-glutamyl-gamma-aminobutyrate hydrolase family protein [Allorhizobium undicola]
MPLPIIAIPADTRIAEGTVWHAVKGQYIDAALKVARAMPLLVPALGAEADVDAVLERVDGVLISGSVSNVYPELYGRPAGEKDGPFDPGRDGVSLPLIRRAIERGIPLLAICRGIQELNVALGGTLASEIQEQPGMWDHRMPETTDWDEAFAIRQTVNIREGSCMARFLGSAGTIQVNSLHRQAISDIAPRLQVEALADDGTIEAVSVIDAKGFAIGVQWHPEYWAETDAPSRALFEAYGKALRDYAAARR